jgi:hypothetical protein
MLNPNQFEPSWLSEAKAGVAKENTDRKALHTAIGKELVNNGLERHNGNYGFKVHFDKNEGTTVVKNIHFGDNNPVAPILSKAGFDVQDVNKHITFVHGKLGAN